MGSEKQKVGGRPKIPWTASRKRKLVRLYLMTTLNYHQIRELISADGFDPCRRNIQAQLSTLLPNIKKNQRIYRPSGIGQGKARLAVWKLCRKHAFRKLKSRREHQGLPEGPLTARNSTENVSVPSPTLFTASPFYDPFAHWNYEALLPFGVPTHVSMPEIGSWYSNTQLNPSPLSGQAPSATREDRDSDKEVHVDLGQVSGIEGLLSELDKPPLSTAGDISQTRVSDQQKSNPPTHRVSNASFKTMSTRISSGIFRASRHVNSVLSMTNSVRSSLVSAMSISSRGSSISRNVSMYDMEQWIRDMIVDEAVIQPTPIGTSSMSTCMRSLHQRPCCKFNLSDIFGVSKCELCGFTAIHELFRNQCGSEGLLGDITTRDTFGNTPLHHAAAAGNVKRIENVLKVITASDVPLLALRNTSGETFLHVVVKPVDLFSSSYPAYREIRDQFKVDMRDFHGRSVTDRMLEEGIRQYPQFASVEELDLSLIEAIKALDLDYGGLCPLVDKLIDEDYQHVRLHVRNKDGLTALAIAAARGYPDIVLSLLHHGANPNVRTQEGPTGRSILGHIAKQMPGEKDHARFSRILCCANLLADSGAKFDPTEFEEYCMKNVGAAGKSFRDKAIESPILTEKIFVGIETSPMMIKKKKSARLLVPAATSSGPPERGFYCGEGPRDLYDSEPVYELSHQDLFELDGIELRGEPLVPIHSEFAMPGEPSARRVRPVPAAPHWLPTLPEDYEMAYYNLEANPDIQTQWTEEATWLGSLGYSMWYEDRFFQPANKPYRDSSILNTFNKSLDPSRGNQHTSSLTFRTSARRVRPVPAAPHWLPTLPEDHEMAYYNLEANPDIQTQWTEEATWLGSLGYSMWYEDGFFQSANKPYRDSSILNTFNKNLDPSRGNQHASSLTFRTSALEAHLRSNLSAQPFAGLTNNPG
ncbi:hypothetical protein ACMFMG_008760 [Clarireedia jacksonii]